MTSKQTVLVLGATGGVGAGVTDALLEDGSFDVRAFTRPTSASKPDMEELKKRGVSIVVGDVAAPAAELVPHLKGIDIVVSCLGANAQLAQLGWVDAAKEAGVKRFVPCGYTTISPRGAMRIRDEKETVHDRIFFRHLPFTIIDVGYWHQISFPWLPSGKVDYAAMAPLKEIYGDGSAPTLLTDNRDQGKWVARIIKDPRTLNKRVVTHSDELSQNQIWDIMEKVSGETIPRNYISGDEIVKRLNAAIEDNKQSPDDWQKRFPVWGLEYIHSKYIRADNTMENAKYLGYLDARELYPDFKPITFEACVKEIFAGSIPPLYGGKNVLDVVGGLNGVRSETKVA